MLSANSKYQNLAKLLSQFGFSFCFHFHILCVHFSSAELNIYAHKILQMYNTAKN